MSKAATSERRFGDIPGRHRAVVRPATPERDSARIR